MKNSVLKSVFVDVLIPCYNSEKTIERCISSVLNQSYKNINIIIVNDGSTDNSLELIKNINSKPNKIKIKIINQENKGISKTRNVLLENSKSQYIYFLDSDDYIEVLCIEEFINELAKNPNLEMIFNSCKFLKNKKLIKRFITDYSGVKTKEDILIKKGLYLWNILIKKDFLEKNNFKFNDKYSFFEDCGVIAYWIYKVEHFSILNNYNYVYSIASKFSLTQQRKKDEKTINDGFEQFNNLVSLFKKENFKSFPRGVNDQFAFYLSILHTYVFFQSSLNWKRKRYYKKIIKSNIKKLNIKFPKQNYKFWYFFLLKLI